MVLKQVSVVHPPTLNGTVCGAKGDFIRFFTSTGTFSN